MIAIHKHIFKNPYFKDNTLWTYTKNGYTMKITFETPLLEQDGFYQINYKWNKTNDATILTLFEDKQDNRLLGLFISEYCYRIIKGQKLFEAKHPEECKKFGIYTTGTIIEASTDTRGLKHIFVFDSDGWHTYEKPEAVCLYKELQSFYQVQELI